MANVDFDNGFIVGYALGGSQTISSGGGGNGAGLNRFTSLKVSPILKTLSITGNTFTNIKVIPIARTLTLV